MQAELIYRKSASLMMTNPATQHHQELSMAQAMAAAARAKRESSSRNSRETIHSGHFMVSDFEAEAQDDEDELAVPVPDEEAAARLAIVALPGFNLERFVANPQDRSGSQQLQQQQLSIETSLNKLFKCMSLAYRQKLTSPKWNRFKGIRLRWKDKIRLNNVIWRCWHMQFILKQNTLVCQFASPLDVDTHNKPEAIVLEGKYWKRKLAAVTAEYKKWRMFYRNRILGWTSKDGSDMLEAMDTLEWGGGIGNSGMFELGAGGSYGGGIGPTGVDAVHNMMVDEDYMDLMSDTLFSTISSNQPIYFPDPREIARGASLADFIQPSLGPLQPNLDDFIDTLEPLQEFLSSRLPPVPEEDVYQSAAIAAAAGAGGGYPDLDLIVPLGHHPHQQQHHHHHHQQQQQHQVQQAGMVGAASAMTAAPGQSMQTEDSSASSSAASAASSAVGVVGGLQSLQYTAKIYTQPNADPVAMFRNNACINQSYQTIQQTYEQQMQQAAPPVREKQPRQSRALLRASRLAQQQQQQQQQHQQQQVQQHQQQQVQQQNYQTAAAAAAVAAAQQQQQQHQQQHQHLTYPNSQRDYGMRLSNAALAVPSDQMQLALTDQSHSQVQTLMGQQQQQPQSTFVQTERRQQTQQQTQQVPKQQHKSNISCKPYSKISNQGYKFAPPAPSFDAQQCKFTANNPKVLPSQSVVSAVTTQQSVQPQVFLQCKPDIDLTAPALHPTKLMPRPIAPAPVAAPVDKKEEVFAVPKYQMKVRNRSRSSSSLVAPRMHPPPLVSAVSDPALNINNNVLLAHLLTNNSTNLYGVSSTDKAASQPGLGVKHMLPMLPSTLAPGTQTTKAAHHMTSSGTVQAMQPINNVQSQSQTQSSGSSQQLLLNTSAQSALQSQSSNPNSPKESTSAHSPSALNISPLHSPMSIGSPLSPTRIYVKGEPDQQRGQYKEQRRVGHIHAEQKRRYNIKNGFDMLYSLIPQMSQNPNTKMSKAAMLQKGADYIRLLRSERHQLKDEMDKLRSQIETLNAAINNCQSLLPATGAPVSRQRTNKMKEMFDEYVRTRTRDNWKFWIFSILLEPLMVSFNTSVSTASIEDLYRTTILWVEQHCSLVDLRPAVLNSLRYLCTATDILNDPSRLPEEALAAVDDNERRKTMQ